MADDADIAADRDAVAMAARLARVDAAIPAGVAGECDECGEEMPRLVGGLCGFCRDGRRPPLAIYDRLDAVVPTAAKEPSVMANPKPSKDYQQISVPARGEPLTAIRQHATERDLPLGQAVLSIVEEWLAGGVVTNGGAAADLVDARTEDLMAELGRRVSGASAEDIAALNARAEAAETRLAAVTAALGGAV